jgi:hypothetical protein
LRTILSIFPTYEPHSNLLQGFHKLGFLAFLVLFLAVFCLQRIVSVLLYLLFDDVLV